MRGVTRIVLHSVGGGVAPLRPELGSGHV